MSDVCSANATVLMTPDDVAKRLAISKEGVCRLIHRGALNCRKVGRLLRFTPDDLDTFLDRARVNK